MNIILHGTSLYIFLYADVHLLFSPIKVVEGDIAGIVYDGPDEGKTTKYQLDTSTVTVNFAGFVSARDGISHYEWSVGTNPGQDDVMPYSPKGLIVDEKGTPHIGNYIFFEQCRVNKNDLYFAINIITLKTYMYHTKIIEYRHWT